MPLSKFSRIWPSHFAGFLRPEAREMGWPDLPLPAVAVILLFNDGVRRAGDRTRKRAPAAAE